MPLTIQRDIASGVVITGLVLGLSVYLPIAGFFFAIFIPLPTLFYRSKLGRNTGAIVPVVLIVSMISFIGSISIDVLFCSEQLLLGFVLGELIEKDISIEKTVMYASGAVILAGILGLLFYSGISSTGIVMLATEYVDKNLKLTISLYENMGVPQDSINMISNSLENIRFVMVRIIPGLSVALIFFITWTNLLLARPVLKNKNLFVPEFGSLDRWKAPEFIIWGIIGCGLLFLMPDKNFKIIGLNGLLVLMTIYFFQGIAIVSYFFEKKNFPRMLRFFLYTLIAVQQAVLLVVVGLGLFDMWVNFRKLNYNKEN